MLNITHAIASENILRFCDEGRLTQARWHDRDADGRELACLLGSLDPSVDNVAICNGDLMPLWLAKMTPGLFDGINVEKIYPLARRYGELIGRWGVLLKADWDAILASVLVHCIDLALDTARPTAEDKPYWG